MPDINAGNTNAPAMMMGSRCAAFVAEGAGRPAVPEHDLPAARTG
jgi:choline dehydrogenase-like flavoprotein